MDRKDAATVVSNVSRRSFPFLQVLTLIFVFAKLGGLIDWSWWMVFAPLWVIPAALVGVLVAFFGGLGLIWLLLEASVRIENAIRSRSHRKFLEKAKKFLEEKQAR